MEEGKTDEEREGRKKRGEEGKQGALPYLFFEQLHFTRQLALLGTISYIPSLEGR